MPWREPYENVISMINLNFDISMLNIASNKQKKSTRTFYPFTKKRPFDVKHLRDPLSSLYFFVPIDQRSKWDRGSFTDTELEPSYDGKVERDLR